jgi:probable HAF family extracellular repeat protein
MNFRIRTAVALVTLAVTLPLPAQDNANHKPKHHQYKLHDLGTFGGPGSVTAIEIPNLNNSGAALGLAQTTTPDPYNPNCMDGYFGGLSGCLLSHAYGWQDGVLTDLGALPGNNSSFGYAINNAGVMNGISETGAVDPQTGYPEVHAVVWKKGTITDLGTFGGTQSQPGGINDRGQVVGWAMNTVADPFSAAFEATGENYGWPGTTQLRAFLWEDGVKIDLGTLGGPDAQAYAINQRGQIAGQSFTSYNPNPDSGIPTIDPFLWDQGAMIDLGNLGGDISWTVWLNERGQVGGTSYLAGDQARHAFLWDHGVLTDLGTLGGTNSSTEWLSNGGEVVGGSQTPGNQTVHAVVWSRGVMSDLGAVPGDNASDAYAINSAGSIVGLDCDSLECQSMKAFLWENSGPMVDLNALVYPPSTLHVYWAVYINDRGEILGWATDSSGNTRAVLLVPDGDCDSACEQRIADSQNNRAVVPPVSGGARLPAFGKPADGVQKGRVAPFLVLGRAVALSN